MTKGQPDHTQAEAPRPAKQAAAARRAACWGAGALLLFAGIMYCTVSSISPCMGMIGQHAAACEQQPFLREGLGEGISLSGTLGEGIGCGDVVCSISPNEFKLVGTFYDLKMTRSGDPSEIAERVVDQDGREITRLRGSAVHEYGEVLSRFFKHWRESELAAYYRTETKQYAAYFYQPSVESCCAPKVFCCDEVTQPGGWLCVYRGCVRAPKSGKFRFVGAGDDFLVVRFNRRNVLEAGYYHPSLWQKDKPAAALTYGPENAAGGGWRKFWDEVKAGKHQDFAGYELIRNIPRIPRWNRELGGMTAGKVFEVEEGQVYPIDVAVGDLGGMMGFVLFIEEVTDGSPAAPEPELFRTRFVEPNMEELRARFQEGMDGSELQAPPYDENSYIWTAMP